MVNRPLRLSVAAWATGGRYAARVLVVAGVLGGILVAVLVLQSYAQGEAVWGRSGMRTLWSAATVKLLGAGLDEAAFVEDVSRLIGDHDVPADSRSHGDGRTTRTSSTRRERILPAAELRALPKGSALLLATGTRPALLSLLPWYDGPRAAAVASEVQTATAGISRRGATAGVR